jgi:hypothetical protein
MADCVTGAVVEPCGALQTDVQVVPEEHHPSLRPPCMAPALQPSYQSTYQEAHKADFERLLALV